jgi:hypothetical protein
VAYFFFSYARLDALDRYLHRFYDDLRRELATRGGIQVEETGYLDTEQPAGVNWSSTAGKALATAKLFPSCCRWRDQYIGVRRAILGSYCPFPARWRWSHASLMASPIARMATEGRPFLVIGPLPRGAGSNFSPRGCIGRAHVIGALTGVLLKVIELRASTVVLGAVAIAYVFVLVSLVLRSAWFWFALAVPLLAARGTLPIRVLPFLEDAYHRQILRRVGRVYQFRHARIQDYLGYGLAKGLLKGAHLPLPHLILTRVLSWLALLARSCATTTARCRVALAVDSTLADLAPRGAEHFGRAELRHFGYDELDDAVAWAAGPNGGHPAAPPAEAPVPSDA